MTSTEKNEGAVAHRAVDKAKELPRKKAPFVWNATHLSEQTRTKTLDLLFAYHADFQDQGPGWTGNFVEGVRHGQA
jgi:predicted kinase